MTNYRHNRRTFITSVGSMFTLPLLESLWPLTASAQTAANDPRRYICFYFPNGTYNRGDQATWYPPTGTLNAATLPPVLTPFAGLAGDYSIYKNIATQATDQLSNAVGQHPAAAVAFMTCSPNMNPQISFEHMLAAKVGKPALVLQGNTGDQGDSQADNGISFLNGRVVRGLSNPGDLYRQLLGQVVTPSPSPSPAPQPKPAPSPAIQGSILDSALEDLNGLRAKLGKSDQQRLDDYQAGIRALELKLGATPPSGPSSPSGPTTSPACVQPRNNSTVDSSSAAANSSLYLDRMRTFNDLITIAFACDITRSVSVMLDVETGSRSLPAAPSELIYKGADIAGWNNHLVSHFGHFDSGDFAHSTPDGIPRCITRDRFYLSVVADLINKLKNAKDASGSAILDNTIIHSGFGIKDGMHRIELAKSPPTLVAGGRNFITPGQSFDFSSYDVADMFYTFSTHLGLGIPSFQTGNKLIKL